MIPKVTELARPYFAIRQKNCLLTGKKEISMPYDPSHNGQNHHNEWRPVEQGSPRTPSQAFSMMSITFAILGIATFFLIITPICFGSLAIIFGLLSRGQNRRAARPASIGIPLGTISILIGAAVLVFGIFSIIHQFGSFENYLNLIEQQVQRYYAGETQLFDMSQFM